MRSWSESSYIETKEDAGRDARKIDKTVDRKIDRYR